MTTASVPTMPSATPSAPLAPAVAGTVDEQAVAAQTSSSAKTSQRAFFLFDDTPTKEDLKHPLEHFQARRAFFAKLVIAETWMLVALVMLLVIVIPLTQTQYLFKTQPFVMPLDFTSKVPDTLTITPLSLPNMTRQAVLSWTASTVTDVMTFNFANFNERISEHEKRFWPEAWVEYVKALFRDFELDKFQRNQLVLTTAPVGSPIIIAEGLAKERYQWVVEIPVVMNFITNNNKNATRKNFVRLTITRAPTDKYPQGIAIKHWTNSNESTPFI